MNFQNLLSKRLLAVLLGGAVLMALPMTGNAKPKHDDDKHHSKNHHNHHYSRDVFFSYPRSSWTVAFGTGYAGSGYYYGPPNADYYYEGSGVLYYPRRELVPRQYYSGGSYGSGSMDASVQRALARRGYNPGPIDGEIGPTTQRAIMRYQADHGLRVTGYVDSSLMRSLGL